MIKFRGETKEGKVVEGYYLYLKHFPGGWMDDDPKEHDRHMIFPVKQECSNPYDAEGTIHRGVYYQVTPQSLAMSMGINDRNKAEIFGSFPVDGKMSEGGDDVTWWPEDYHWENDEANGLKGEEIGRIVWIKDAARWAIETEGKINWSNTEEFLHCEVIKDKDNG